MQPRKCQKLHAGSSCSSSVWTKVPASSLDDDDPSPTVCMPARSLDDDDPSPTASPTRPSTLHASKDPFAIQLCKTLLSFPEQLKRLESGRYTEDKAESDVFEVHVDRAKGSVEVRRLRERPCGLEGATTEARERVANQITKRKQDIAGLEGEVASLNARIEQSEEDEDMLSRELYGIRRMIGKHKQELKELERLDRVEVEVEVERVSTLVDIIKEEKVSVEKRKRLMPMRDSGLYALGGKAVFGNERSALASMEQYDSKTAKWTEVSAPMTCKRASFAVAVLGTFIYAIGGTSNDASLSSVERYSTRSGSWELVAPMPMARSGIVAGVLNGNSIYVAGGGLGKSCLSSVIRFDLGLQKWSQVAPMHVRRFAAGGAVLEGFFYVLGGWDETHAWRTVEKYDPIRNAWQLVAPMKTPRLGCAAAVLNGKLYAIGGTDDNYGRLASVERFDAKANRWVDVAPMSCPRSGADAAVLDGRLYVMGGDNNNSNLSSVERYDEEHDRWEQVAAMTSSRFTCRAAVV